MRALRASGPVVGRMGDGINNVPMMRAADTMPREYRLQRLDDGVVEGRTTFCNVLQCIRMTMCSPRW